MLHDTGNMGEFISSVILSRAFDQAVYEIQHPSEAKVGLGSPTVSTFETRFNHPISVETFLSKLGKEMDATGKLQLVCFLQFVVARRSITTNMLKQAYERRAAFICKPNQESIDICIPIAIPPPGSAIEELSANPESSLLGFKFSAIVVQVKNWHSKAPSSKDMSAWFTGMDNLARSMIDVTEQHYCVLMLIGPKWHHSFEVEHNHHLLLQKIEHETYSFLDDEQCALLRSLAIPSTAPDHYYVKIKKLYKQDVQNVLDLSDPLGATIYEQDHKAEAAKNAVTSFTTQTREKETVQQPMKSEFGTEKVSIDVEFSKEIGTEEQLQTLGVHQQPTSSARRTKQNKKTKNDYEGVV